ncbi:conserved hypothetical protein [Brevibacillus sp. IT-7CA2]
MEGVPGFEPGIRVLQTRALPLGYTPMLLWGDRWDLNPRVPEPQSGALTPSPRPPYFFVVW